MRGKRFVVCLVLFSLLSSLSFSDAACLTVEEMEELEAIFVRLGKTLNEQATELTLLKADLIAARHELIASKTEIETLSQTLTEVEASYNAHETDALRRTILTGTIAGLSGLVIGLLVGLLL